MKRGNACCPSRNKKDYTCIMRSVICKLDNLERCKLLTLTKEEMENLNRFKQLKLVITKLHRKKTQDQIASLVNSMTYLEGN